MLAGIDVGYLNEVFGQFLELLKDQVFLAVVSEGVIINPFPELIERVRGARCRSLNWRMPTAYMIW